MLYPYYSRDFAELLQLLKKNKEGNDTPDDLKKAVDLACTYFSRLSLESEFLQWVDSPGNIKEHNEEFSSCLHELVIPQTVDLMKSAGLHDPEIIADLTTDAQRLLSQKKLGILVMQESIKEKISGLQKEICAHIGILLADTTVVNSSSEGTATATQEKKEPAKIWDSLEKAVKLMTLLTGLIVIDEFVEKKVNEKEETKKEIKIDPAKKEESKADTYKVTGQFWIDVIRRYPPGDDW